MNHTPGPWKVEEDDSGLYISMEPLAENDEYLAIYASPDPEQRLADAYLIAAAPLLLRALETIERIVESFKETSLRVKGGLCMCDAEICPIHDVLREASAAVAAAKKEENR